MLTDEGKSSLGNKLLDDFFNHPLIKYMNSGSLRKSPSYISAQNFSKTILDILKGFEALNENESLNKIKEKLKEFDNKGDNAEWNSDTLKLMYSFMNDSQNNVKNFKESLESWYNDMMDRASGWYKRQTQLIILFTGLAIAIAFNVNTFEIINRLSRDKNARDQLVTISENYVKNRVIYLDSSKTSVRLDSLVLSADSLYKADIQNINNLIGLGWDSWEDFVKGFPLNILGCLATALAISLGAPFWFDLLSKFVKLRGTGNKPPEQKTA
jgi:hypothetical protein